MVRKSEKTLLTAICLVLCLYHSAYAQKQPACVAEVEKMLIEAEISDDHSAAYAKANGCAEQNRKSVEAQIILSKTAALRHEFGVAMYAALTATELAPQSADALYAKGLVNQLRFFLEFPDRKLALAAIADYEKALALNPRHGLSLLGKSLLARESLRTPPQTLLPDFDRAIENLKASGGSAADLSEAYLGRGVTYKKDKQWESAINDLTTALKLKPNHVGALYARAEVYETRTDQPDLEAAIADLTAIIKIKPKNFYYEKRGDLYEKKGDVAKAVSDYRSALALNSYSPRAKSQLEKLAPAAATAATPNQTPQNPAKQPTAEEYAADGRRQAAQKNYDAAIKSFSECLRLKPDAVSAKPFAALRSG